MITVILVIHLLIALALVGVILLQRSEGGALGIGGGGGGGGLVSGRAAGKPVDPRNSDLGDYFFRDQPHPGHPGQSNPSRGLYR